MSAKGQGQEEQESLLDEGQLTSFLNNNKNAQYKLSAENKKWLRIVKFVGMLLCAISATVALILVLITATKDTLNLTLFASTDYRNGDVQAADGYPQWDGGVELYCVNVGVLAAIVSGLAALAYLFNWFMHEHEVKQMNGGANPYLHTFLWVWSFVAIMLAAFLAGVHNVYLHVMIALAVWCASFGFWTDDLLHAHGFLAVQQFLVKEKKALASSGWSVLPTVFAWVPLIVVYVVILIYLAMTMAAGSWAAGGISTATEIGSVCVIMGLYLANPLMCTIEKFSDGHVTIYFREMFLYCWNLVLILMTTWLTIGLFAVDDIVPQCNIAPIS